MLIFSNFTPKYVEYKIVLKPMGWEVFKQILPTREGTITSRKSVKNICRLIFQSFNRNIYIVHKLIHKEYNKEYRQIYYRCRNIILNEILSPKRITTMKQHFIQPGCFNHFKSFNVLAWQQIMRFMSVCLVGLSVGLSLFSKKTGSYTSLLLLEHLLQSTYFNADFIIYISLM